MMDNEIFKILYDNVVDLLPHFEPGSAKVPRRRSGSQDKHKMLEHTKQTSSQDSSEIVVEPFKSPLDSRSALKKILNVLSKFDPDDLMKSNARSAIWKEVRARTGDFFGLSVNPKGTLHELTFIFMLISCVFCKLSFNFVIMLSPIAFIEGYKDSVISTIKSTPGADRDAQLRAKIFLKLASDMLPYFDYIAPKSVKKSDFLLPEVETREPSPSLITEPKKRKLEVCVRMLFFRRILVDVEALIRSERSPIFSAWISSFLSSGSESENAKLSNNLLSSTESSFDGLDDKREFFESSATGGLFCSDADFGI